MFGQSCLPLRVEYTDLQQKVRDSINYIKKIIKCHIILNTSCIMKSNMFNYICLF